MMVKKMKKAAEAASVVRTQGLQMYLAPLLVQVVAPSLWLRFRLLTCCSRMRTNHRLLRQRMCWKSDGALSRCTQGRFCLCPENLFAILQKSDDSLHNNIRRWALSTSKKTHYARSMVALVLET